MHVINMKTPLACPVCASELNKVDHKKMYMCPKGHVYDIAKQGYVNLLMSNMKGSLKPGDSAEMIQARKHFLNAGFYQGVSDKMKDIIYQCLPTDGTTKTILDVGCGEGYYLAKLKAGFSQGQTGLFFGVDIAKEAIKSASKRDGEITWIVGNNFHLPFKEASLDVVYSVFSPINFEACARVLKPGGYLVRVLPNEGHLIEMRKVIYAKIDARDKDYEKNISEKLTLTRKEALAYEISPGREAIDKLFKMTPHYWRANAQDKEKLAAYSHMTLSVDMGFYVYQKE